MSAMGTVIGRLNDIRERIQIHALNFFYILIPNSIIVNIQIAVDKLQRTGADIGNNIAVNRGCLSPLLGV